MRETGPEGHYTVNHCTPWATPPACFRKKGVKKADIALHGNPISEIRDVTCHMGSHSVTCHPTQVNAPRLTPAIQAGTRVTYPWGMEGWVDLVWRISVCHTGMLRIRKIGDWESKGQQAYPGLHGKWPLKWCIVGCTCIVSSALFNVKCCLSVIG